MERVLLIGLDGATWTLLTPWIREGHLPTFKRLMEEGVYGELESTVPPLSIPAWNSLTTGKNPGKLGVFSFLSMNRETHQFKPDFLFAQHRFIWDILGEMGKKVIVLNVPCVHRAYKVNGYLAVGFLYLDKTSLTYPEDLKMKLDETTGGYNVDVLDTDKVFGTVEKRFEFVKNSVKKLRANHYLEKTHATIEKRFKAVQFLLEKKWDFAFVVFVAPDRVQHRFWENKKAILEVYCKLDSNLNKIIKLAGKNTTLIMLSDHGFGSRKIVFNINEWLLKEGYLRLKTKDVHHQTKTNSFIRTIGILPFFKSLSNWLPFRIKQYFGEKVNYARVDGSKVDWKLTQVFTQPSEENYGDLYISIREKDASGIVDAVHYQEVLSEVRRKLKNLRNPLTGKLASPRVYTKEEIYVGQHLDKAPDLVILPDDNIHGFNTTIGHNKIFTIGEGGEHRMHGILLAHGPNIRRGVEVKDARIYDILPTVLHIFNMPIPKDCDGKVLKDVFNEESEPAKRAITYLGFNRDEKEVGTHTYTSEEEDEIKKRLGRLGYL